MSNVLIPANAAPLNKARVNSRQVYLPARNGMQYAIDIRPVSTKHIKIGQLVSPDWYRYYSYT